MPCIMKATNYNAYIGNNQCEENKRVPGTDCYYCTLMTIYGYTNKSKKHGNNKKNEPIKKTNHQYSERGARPFIVAYLSKHTLIESDSVIIVFFEGISALKVHSTI